MLISKTTPKKSLGQNFLVNKETLYDFITSIDIKANDVIIEVGSGTGIITKELVKKAKKIIAVEFDRELIPTLKNNLKDFDNIELINSDILELIRNLKLVIKNSRYKVTGSIPYNITKPLLYALVTSNKLPITINLIIQYEVAKKISAKPPKATYLSNLIQLYGEVKIIKKVPPSAFYPIPKVNSAIVKIVKGKRQQAKGVSAKEFAEFLHRGFRNPRKMLNKSFKKEFLIKAGINPTLRPANLTLNRWLKLMLLTYSHG